MTNDPTAKKLADLDVADAAGVARLFAELGNQFAADLDSKPSADQWEELRAAWLGRKSGVLTRITDNWLKPATPELKRAVGASLNELRAHVESKIEERRKSIEAGAGETASARERVDLSLPGVDATDEVETVRMAENTKTGWDEADVLSFLNDEEADTPKSGAALTPKATPTE